MIISAVSFEISVATGMISLFSDICAIRLKDIILPFAEFCQENCVNRNYGASIAIFAQLGLGLFAKVKSPKRFSF
jgi:hypothetical protein